MGRWLKSVSLLLLPASLATCATLADSGGGDTNMPNAGAGPFREIEQLELGRGVAPFALGDDGDFPRDASILDVDGDLQSLEAWGYVAHTVFAEGVEPDPAAPANEIVRHIALDGRSFDRFPIAVLTAEPGWEGGVAGSPSALWVGDEVWLYYAAAGGVGLAVSSDGAAFSRVGDGPVLSPAGGWEQQAVPQSPTVVRLEDGGFHMFYELTTSAGPVIGEARSADGISWQRVGQQPALAAGAANGWEGGGVEAPFAVLTRSAEGRLIEQLYYGAISAEGDRVVALAARYDAEGSFQRASAPVFGTSGSLEPTEPCVVRHDGFSLLFASARRGTSAAQDYPAVAVGVAPATVTLPAPVAP